MPHRDLIAAVVTPNAVDAELAISVLAEHHIAAQAFSAIGGFARSLSPAVGCAILVEEALVAEELASLRESLGGMPEWSDLPLVIVTNDLNARVGLVASAFPDSVNVTFLEQPVNPLSLVSAVQVAMRAASRQREVAELIAERDRAVKLRDEFLAMLAHELRNPLAPMRNALYLLKRNGNQDAYALKSTQILERQLNHVARLVDDLMDVARLERGKITLKTHPVDLNRVVAAAVEVLQQAAQEKGHRLLAELSGEALMIDADEVRVTQIVSNLIGNAIKFSISPCTIRVATRMERNCAVLGVEDEGIGFDPAVVDQLFDPFIQVNSTLERSTGGLGMGLTIVKRLVELHRGSVSARSEGIGKGSRFVVRIPLSTTAAPRSDEALPLPTAFHRRRVVVVEDNSDIRETLSMLLTSWGHEVLMAEDGPSGIDCVLQERPDVALVDIGLPLMNGYEVARSIRKRMPSANIRLVAVSGYGQPEDKDLAVQAGFDVHLLKPLDPEILERLLSDGVH